MYSLTGRIAHSITIIMVPAGHGCAGSLATGRVPSPDRGTGENLKPAERQEIERTCRELVLRVTYHSDRGDASAAGELFTADARWFRANKLYVGREAILASYEDFSPTLVARHLIGTPYISVIDQDHASSVTYYTAFVRDPGTTEPAFPIPFDGPFTMGEWHDEFVRTEHGWLFSSRATHRMFQHGEAP
jgi:hypothetical protein